MASCSTLARTRGLQTTLKLRFHKFEIELDI
jgi:hypothetical protein